MLSFQEILRTKMKSMKIICTFTFLFFFFQLSAQNAFITTWKTDNPGTSEDNQISIPTVGVGYNYEVDWGDGNSNTAVTGNITHTYSNIGTYTVTISGSFPRIFFADSGDEEKLLTIEQWGDIEWASFHFAFDGCTNLHVNASDAPDLSGVTNLSTMFQNAKVFNESINHWDVSTITDMGGMFFNCTSFNQPLSNWDVSNVTEMSGMFRYATSFNQNLNSWNTGNVTSMELMFEYDSMFNQSLNSWNTSNVTNMRLMFRNAISFNGDISNWDVSSVNDMSFMFYRASSFNGELGNWDVSAVNDMDRLFYDAISFNQPIGNWNVSNVTNMQSLFWNAGSFNQDIGNWDVSSVTNMNRMFAYARSFNQNIDAWDVSNVTDTELMFSWSTTFDQPLGSWDVSNVNNMSGMFKWSNFNQEIDSWNTSNVTDMSEMFNTSEFNQNLSSWNTANVTNMSSMFRSARFFDQDLSDWDIRQVSNFRLFLNESGLSSENYDLLLQGWAILEGLGTNVQFDANGISYCEGREARKSLIEDLGWEITDEGQSCKPEDIFLDNLIIEENNQVGFLVGILSSTDADTTDTHNYTLNVENDELFYITNNELFANSSFNYEATSNIPITITSTDSKGLSFSKDFTILIEDLNEAPIISVTENPVSMPEDAADEYVVTTLNVVDPDGLEVMVNKIGGDPNNAFFLNQEGLLWVLDANQIDYESDSSYVLTIRAYDGFLESLLELQIKITDINESPVVKDTLFRVKSNIDVGSVIGQVATEDPENDSLSFSFVSGNSGNHFNINDAGEIIINNSEFSEEQYDLIVEISDGEFIVNAVIVIVIERVLSVSKSEIIYVYPNPTHSKVFINLQNSRKSQIKLLNESGKCLMSAENVTSVDLNDYPEGIYILSINNNGYFSSYKLIKRD